MWTEVGLYFDSGACVRRAPLASMFRTSKSNPAAGPTIKTNALGNGMGTNQVLAVRSVS